MKRTALKRKTPLSRAHKDSIRRGMLAKDLTGERNPNYRHGRNTGETIRGWSVAEKGETCCRVCGGTSGGLDLHHVVPRSKCPPEAKRDLRNGICLCHSCHRRFHTGTLTIPRSVFTPDEWRYISRLVLTGRDTAGWLDKHYPDLDVARAA